MTFGVILNSNWRPQAVIQGVARDARKHFPNIARWLAHQMGLRRGSSMLIFWRAYPFSVSLWLFFFGKSAGVEPF